MTNFVCKGVAMFGFGNLCEQPVTTSDSASLFGLTERFHAHMAEESLSFGTKEEYSFRFQKFQDTDVEINEWNSAQDSFELGHNKFSTMTEVEFGQFLGGHPPASEVESTTLLDETNLPDSKDWRKEGAVNPVRNQGRCGSCWAFGATAALETAYFLKHGTLPQLSEQQIVSCNSPPNKGCRGGAPSTAYNYLKTQGLASRSVYKYTSGNNFQTGKCNKNLEAKGFAKIESFKTAGRSWTQQKAAIQQTVPSMYVAANLAPFKNYKRGIINTPKCGTKVNHIVNGVGYGTTAQGQNFYIIRNSWGARWGENGYVRIAASDWNKGWGICSIQSFTDATVAV